MASAAVNSQPGVFERLEACLDRQILIIDGAMGTMLQTYELDEAGYRGERFADHHVDIKGCSDILCLTRPEIVAEIHAAISRLARTSSKPTRSEPRRSPCATTI